MCAICGAPGAAKAVMALAIKCKIMKQKVRQMLSFGEE
jgi:hypothetical protein